MVYGPFNYDGQFTSDSNRQFNGWLKAADPQRQRLRRRIGNTAGHRHGAAQPGLGQPLAQPRGFERAAQHQKVRLHV